MAARVNSFSGLRSTIMGGISAVALSATIAIPAQAQDAAAEEKDSGVGIIVVTAQRQQQTILDVPVSATVLTETALEQTNSQSALDYLKLTPNVSFRQSGRNGAREIVISIRGIADLKGGEKVSTQSAFTTFVDDFSLGTLATSQANPNIYDVEAVEVLRGPQGVFFGRNAEGGAINIRTKRPEPELGGRVDVGWGRFDSFELAGVANIPISDTVFTRFSAQGTKTDSFLTNLHPTGGDGGNEYLNIRGQIRWVPTDATTIDLQVNHTTDNQNYTPKLSTCVNPSFGFNPFDGNILGGIGCYSPNGALATEVAAGRVTLPAGVTLASIADNRSLTYQNSPEYTRNKTNYFIGQIEHVFNDSVVLNAVSGYSESKSDQYLDLDKSGLDSVDRSGFFETESYSQEIRLASVGENTIDWTIGGIYYSEKSDAQNKIRIKGFLGPWLRGDFANENRIGVERDGWGIFGNAEWHVSDQFSIMGGLRYSQDKDSQNWTEVFAACPRRPIGTPLAAGCTLRPDQLLINTAQVDAMGNVFVSGGRQSQTTGTFGEGKTKDLSGRAAVNWKPNDEINLYASVSKGYKPGGARANPDAGTLANVSIFGKETLWNYEIGGNAYLWDRKALLQFAVFYMDWRDMQVELREQFCTNDPANPVPIDQFVGTGCVITPLDRTVNANKARSKGFELAAVVKPLDGLTLRGALGFTDAKFVDFRDTVRNTPADLSGQRIGLAPKWTGSAGAQYDFAVGDAEANIGIDWSIRSSADLGLVQRAANNFPGKIPAYGTVDIRGGIDFGNHRLNIKFENILGSDYYTGTDGFSFGGAQVDYHPTSYFISWTAEM
ncbi:MAG: TonB-dependent receptor [Parasphingorhabdus sp.]